MVRFNLHQIECAKIIWKIHLPLWHHKVSSNDFGAWGSISIFRQKKTKYLNSFTCFDRMKHFVPNKVWAMKENETCKLIWITKIESNNRRTEVSVFCTQIEKKMCLTLGSRKLFFIFFFIPHARTWFCLRISIFQYTRYIFIQIDLIVVDHKTVSMKNYTIHLIRT